MYEEQYALHSAEKFRYRQRIACMHPSVIAY